MIKFDIIWLGQAGFIMAFAGFKVCVDPYLSDSVEAAEGMKRLLPPPLTPEELDADYLLFTHDHLDHFDQVSIRRLADRQITYYGPISCMKKLAECNIHTGVLLERHGQVTIGGRITVNATYACHTEDSIGLLFQEKGKSSGGLYLTGDTEYSSELAEVKRFQPDVMIACINGKMGNMDYDSAAVLAREIGVRTAIPCHYGMFAENTQDPDKFKAALRRTDICCRELQVMKPLTMKL